MDNQQGKLFNHNKKWTIQEDRYLTVFYTGNDRKTVDEIAKHLGRTKGSVLSRAEYIGLMGTRKGKDSNMVSKQPNSALAYIVGVYLGDGNINSKGQFRLNSIDKDFCEATLNKLIQVLTGPINTRIYYAEREVGQPTYSVIVTSTDLCNWLATVTQNKGLIPNMFLNSDKEVLMALLSGLMDSEGWVSRRKSDNELAGNYQIGIAGNSIIYNFWNDLPKLLNKLNILYNRYEKLGFVTFILKGRSFINSGISLNISRKQKRLNMLKEIYERMPDRYQKASETRLNNSLNDYNDGSLA